MKKLCIILGDPVSHSLSPRMHNEAYKAIGIDYEFNFISAKVEKGNLEKVINDLKSLGNVRGITCTVPHKEDIIRYLDEIDPLAKKIGAVNTVVNNNGILKGYNTDWQGIVIPLERITSIKGKKVAVIGAGGASRAVCYGLLSRGAEVVIYNRTKEKAEILAREMNVKAREIKDICLVAEADIIINTTSIGMSPNINKSLVPKEFIKKEHIVFDIVYSPYDTQLLKDAQEKEATIIHGIDMLLYQGAAQFKLYTGKDAPVDAMKEVLNV